MGSAGGGTSTVTVETVGTGAAPPANQPVPRSPSGATATDNSIPELKPTGDAAQPVTQAPQPAPAQVNEAAGDSQSSATTASSGSQQGSTTSATSSGQGSNQAQSSSKAKKKRKLWPF